MRSTTEIKPGKDHDLPSAVLVGSLSEVDSPSAQIKKKRLVLVC